ncbi:MAG: hypothetical protein FWG14_05285 [Peptococcaceae bacterium]|nr:hypothetical protein [Peptococcaceae bacterium]
MERLVQKLDTLLANYQQDVQIYQEILLETAKMETRLTESAEQRSRSSESVSLSDWRVNSQGSSQGLPQGPSQDSDHGSGVSRGDDQEMDDMELFVSWRQEKLQDISRRRGEMANIRKDICDELGTDNLDEDVIQRVYPELLDPWQRTMADIQEKGDRVLARDEKIFQHLKMDMEFMKLEMHRVQDVKKSRQIYHPQIMGEARFIDKNR